MEGFENSAESSRAEKPFTPTKDFAVTGPSEEGTEFLTNCFNKCLEALQSRDTQSLVELLSSQYANSHQWDKYKINNDTIISRLNVEYREKLCKKFPFRYDFNSFLHYEPSEITNFGEELKRNQISKLEEFRDAQTMKTLDELFAKNKVMKLGNEILSDFHKQLNTGLKTTAFGKSEDVLKFYEELQASSLQKFWEVSNEVVPEAFLNDAIKSLTFELGNRPTPEEVRELRSKETIEAATNKYRELLGLAKVEFLDEFHQNFCNQTINSIQNPFLPGSDWYLKLDEQMKEEIERVFVEVKNKTETAPNYDRRKLNLIFYGLKDAKSEIYKELYNYIAERLKRATNSIIRPVSIRRLGEFRDGALRPRPVRVCFLNEYDKHIVFKHRYSSSLTSKGIRISEDRPKEERKGQTKRKSWKKPKRSGSPAAMQFSKRGRSESGF